MAGAALAWSAHFDSLGTAGTRLVAAGAPAAFAWPVLAWAGAAFGAPGATSAWQLQYFDSLGTAGAWSPLGPQLLAWHSNTWCSWSYCLRSGRSTLLLLELLLRSRCTSLIHATQLTHLTSINSRSTELLSLNSSYLTSLNSSHATQVTQLISLNSSRSIF